MIDTNFIYALAAVGVGLVGGMAADYSAEALNPTHRALVVEELSYENGVFTQQIAPTTGSGIQAVWIAEINRMEGGVTQQLCVGSGEAPYTGTMDSYTADDWTGDDCPELQPGDRAEAVWTWIDENHQKRSVSATVVID